MGLAERRAKEKIERKKLIVGSAMKLIRSSEGVEGLTMRKLADAIEYSPCVVYETFPNKESLIIDLFSSICEELLEVMRSVPPADPEVYFRNLICKDVSFMMKEPYRVELFLIVSMETPPEEFPSAMQKVIELIGNGLQGLGFSKLSTQEQIEQAQDVLRTFLAGLLKLFVSQKSARGLDRCTCILEHGLNVLLNGWRI